MKVKNDWRPEEALGTVPCKWCGEQTPMRGTQECDPCHEIRVKFDYERERTLKILDKILVRGLT